MKLPWPSIHELKMMSRGLTGYRVYKWWSHDIMNSQSRHDAPSVTPALKISIGFGVLSIKVFESNFQFWSSPLSIPNCTQQFLWTLQFNVALPDLVNFMSIASSFETQSPPREGLGAAAKNNSSAVKYAIKRYFFSETQWCCSARLDHRKKKYRLVVVKLVLAWTWKKQKAINSSQLLRKRSIVILW